MHPRPTPFRLAWLILLVPVLGSACKTAPPPTPADIQAQALGHIDMTGSWVADTPQPGEVQDNWLATFNDEQLDSLVKEAIENNLDLRVAGARVEQAAGYVGVAQAALYPAINLFGKRQVRIQGGGSDLSEPVQGIGLNISWEPDIWGRIRYARNAARESYSSARSDYEFARQSLAASVAQAWFLATQTWLQLQLSNEIIRSAQELVRIAEKRHEVGIGTEQDAASARANIGKYRDAARQVQFAHEQSLRALDVLLGRYPAAEIEARHDLPALPGPVPAGMKTDILERRPDIIAAERRVAAAFDLVGEAKAARLPRITLNGNIGLLDIETSTFKLYLPGLIQNPASAVLRMNKIELEKSVNNPTGSINTGLYFPIYQGGALEAEVEIRNAQQRESIADYARTVLTALSEVESALGSAQSLNEREALLHQVVADSRIALDNAMTNYQIGRQDLRIVQLYQLDLHAARIMLLLVQAQQLQERVRLHLALGGSFEAPPAAPDETSPAEQHGDIEPHG